MNIFVGNLSYDLTEDELREAFEEKGEVTSAKIIRDKFTQKSKGFGFVEMAVEEEGEKAIAELNDVELKGRPMRVDKARPPKSRD